MSFLPLAGEALPLAGFPHPARGSDAGDVGRAEPLRGFRHRRNRSTGTGDPCEGAETLAREALPLARFGTALSRIGPVV